MNNNEGNMLPLHFFTLSFGEGKYGIEAVIVVCGRDISITIGGGTSCHIGAAALAIPRSSLANPETVSASASVLCVTGHKEDQIVRSAALSLASTLNCVVLVSAGVHVDQASSEDIKILTGNFNSLLKKIHSELSEYFND